MKNLNADIKNHTFAGVYLFYGDEPFLKRSYKNRLRKAIADDDMNCMTFAGKDIDVGEVISAADTMPFFAERKLIIIEDSGWFKGSQDELTEYLDRLPETTTILFVEDEIDKRGKLYKKVEKIGRAVEMSHPKEDELARWGASILGMAGRRITASDMQTIIESAGNDMERLKGELDKLIAYTEGRDVITRRDIQAVTTVTETNRIFEMVRAISARQTAAAMKLYEDLLALKEPPMRIIYLIARQFDQLLLVKDMMDEGAAKDAIASVLKVPVGVADRMMKQVKNSPRALLKSYVERCADMEKKVKTGDMPESIAVELLIC
jgi:DNA polymerase III subunit delta